MVSLRSLPIALIVAALVHAEVHAGVRDAPCDRALAPALTELENTLSLIGTVVEGRQAQVGFADANVKTIAEIRQSRRTDMMASPDRKLAAAYLRLLEITQEQNRVLANVLRRDLELMGLFTARMKAVGGALRQLRTLLCSEN